MILSRSLFLFSPATGPARRAAGTSFLLAVTTGCSSLNLESARDLGASGQEATLQSSRAVLVSADEYERTLDAETFFHGYAGSHIPPQLLADYRTIQTEIGARRRVFSQLVETYGAFQALAAKDVSCGFETSVNRLGDAVNGYASALNKSLAVANADKDAIARIGGLVGKRIQQRKVKTSSALLRERLAALTRLLEDPLARTQLTSFRMNLAANRSAAVRLLWEKGLMDPTPLISELGADAGLKAGKDAAKIVGDPQNKAIQEGLSAVVVSRLERRLDLIEQSYDASVKTVNELIALHQRLEAGDVSSLTRLRLLTSELKRDADQLSAKTADDN